MLIIAVISFIPCFFLNYIGEEGVYTISSYEMWYHHSYLAPTLLGGFYQRPPLFNWLIIPLSDLIGWNHMLVVSRLVPVLATIGTAFFLIWLSQVLFKNKQLVYLVGLIYLTSDAGLYHGWVAYADPLYCFFAFASVTLLWLSFLKKQARYFLGSLVFLTAAYLTKALTVYFFYGTAFVGLLLYYKSQRKVILKPKYIMLCGVAMCFPFLWSYVTHGITGHGMVGDVMHGFNFKSIADYLYATFICFPLEALLKLFPISLLFLYLLYKKRFHPCKDFFGYKEAMFSLGLGIINVLPYLLFQNAAARYLMMMYPLFSLFLAVFFWNTCSEVLVLRWVKIILSIKIILVCIFLLVYLSQYRPDYQAIATKMMQDTHNKPLYYENTTASGLSVLAFLDMQRFPKPPLTSSASRMEDYFMVSGAAESYCVTDLVKTYSLGRSTDKLYLFKPSHKCAKGELFKSED